MHILLVDDSQDILRLVQQVLALEGHRVSVARDGLEALQKVASQRPDAVILDVNMPMIEGTEVCRRIKTNYTIPVMMLTVRSEQVDFQRGADAGADAYLSKPFDIPVFIEYLNTMLRLRYGKTV